MLRLNIQNNTGILDKRIEALTEGKVLDVSKLQHDGKGAATIKRPTTSRSRKIGGPNLPVVSDNLAAYLMAINMISGASTSYATDIEMVKQYFNNPGASNISRPNLSTGGSKPSIPLANVQVPAVTGQMSRLEVTPKPPVKLQTRNGLLIPPVPEFDSDGSDLDDFDISTDETSSTDDEITDSEEYDHFF